MNPNWALAAVTALGLIVNAVWTVLNLKMANDLRAQIAELKESMRREYVSERICKLRMGVES